MKTSICSLASEKAINAISGTDSVFYKHGVWNKYERKNTDYVIKEIKVSGYGADVDVDENGNYYVSIPNSSDMW